MLWTILRGAWRAFAVLAILSLPFAGGAAQAEIPDELYQALGLSKDASPKELYDALEKRYHAEETGASKGAYADFWEPLPITQYLNPRFYEPPDMELSATREDCVECHKAATPGWVHAWGKSVHANLDEIRNLPADDVRAYKKEIIETVETNLRSLGKLGEGEQLSEVSCIDCHVDVGAQNAEHAKDLRMPDGAACGTCHLQQWAERESERDTLVWPQGQWPDGRPSHALDWRANVETAIWAAMEEREVAEGCTFCHVNQTKCDTCHTRHEFSAVEARKPEACSICHNGVDHNEFENYLLSKHGTIYQTRGDTWNWEARLADSMDLGGQHAPTCQTCHMEYNGTYSHNLVRKVRWAFNPTPAIADNLGHEWFEDRKEAWVNTCSNCHSGRFARTYLDYVDKGILSGLKVEQEAKQVVQKLYDDGLLVGQQTNRPEPPAPEKEGPGQFFQLFWSKGNNPTAVEYEYDEMWEHHLIKHYKGLAHANPGGYTYSEGWSQLIKSFARIKDEDTRLRDMAALKQRVAELEERSHGSLFDLDGPVRKASVGGLGLALLLTGLGAFVFRRRRQ